MMVRASMKLTAAVLVSAGIALSIPGTAVASSSPGAGSVADTGSFQQAVADQGFVSVLALVVCVLAGGHTQMAMAGPRVCMGGLSGSL